jgi:hypothetical protein
VVVELVAGLVLQLYPQLGPEVVEVIAELVADLVLKLASQVVDFEPDELKVRLQDRFGCLAQARSPEVHGV